MKNSNFIPAKVMIFRKMGKGEVPPKSWMD